MGYEIRLVGFIVIIAVFINMTSPEIFTSSLKIQRMVHEEDRLLYELKRFIDHQFERLKRISNFYIDRFRDIQTGHKEIYDIRHPNAIYFAIRKFSDMYSNLLGDQFAHFRSTAQRVANVYIAGKRDVHGAIMGLLRLQRMYKLNAEDMAQGNYEGFYGPRLRCLDAYEIGKTAYSNGHINESIEWLNVSLLLHSAEGSVATSSEQSQSLLAAIKALLGRAHMFTNREVAETFYQQAKSLDPYNPDTVKLENELQNDGQTLEQNDPDYFQNYSRLCRLDSWFDPSVSQSIKQLKRGKVGENVVSELRTSDLSWILDSESRIVDSVAKRIECITGLDNSQNLPAGPSSGEALQVVNYGLGGHYEVHKDPFDNISLVEELEFSGNRIATFLLYLTDVEKGGGTVFTRVGVSVSPVKNMALMWYNYNPALEFENGTYHGGCPVLVGQKWIANKWILTHGNMFRRRCGLSPDATQLDIEADMMNGYK